jgi:DNA-binding winged helix-turn-helix (wHTH) protein
MVYRFGDCSLDTQRHLLQRTGQPVRLRSKVFQVLRYLLEHRDRTVLKQELYEQVWPQQFISEATLESTVRTVRQAIGDSGRRQQLIQTVYGYGYRFSAAVQEGVDPSEGTAGEAMRAHPDVAPVALMPSFVDEPDDAPATDARAEAGLTPQPEPPRHHDTAAAGEWKVVTVLCCALAKAPVGSAPPEPEAWARQVRALYVLARDVVPRHGGVLRPVMGEHIIAVFGAAAAQEDHAQRAVLAALELQRRLRDAQDEALEVGTGLHTALVTVS